MNKISKEYVIAGALLVGLILKRLGIEIPSADLELILSAFGLIAIQYFRYKKGDINAFGGKKSVWTGGSMSGQTVDLTSVPTAWTTTDGESPKQ